MNCCCSFMTNLNASVDPILRHVGYIIVGILLSTTILLNAGLLRGLITSFTDLIVRVILPRK